MVAGGEIHINLPKQQGSRGNGVIGGRSGWSILCIPNTNAVAAQLSYRSSCLFDNDVVPRMPSFRVSRAIHSPYEAKCAISGQEVALLP